MPFILGYGLTALVPIIDIAMFQQGLLYNGYTQEVATSLNGIYVMKHQSLIGLPVTIAAAIATASIPYIAASAIKNIKDELNEKIITTLKMTFLICIPSSVGMFVLSKPVNALLFPGESSNLISVILKIAAISVVFLGVSTVSIGILQGLGQSKLPIRNTFIGLIVKIILNALFVYFLNLNIFGVVFSNVVFSLILAILNIASIMKYSTISARNLKQLIYVPTCVALLMGVVCKICFLILDRTINNDILEVLFPIILSILFYLLLILKFKVLNEKEIVDMPKGARFLRLLKKMSII